MKIKKILCNSWKLFVIKKLWDLLIRGTSRKFFSTNFKIQFIMCFKQISIDTRKMKDLPFLKMRKRNLLEKILSLLTDFNIKIHRFNTLKEICILD